jgi:hypothetical protein
MLPKHSLFLINSLETYLKTKDIYKYVEFSCLASSIKLNTQNFITDIHYHSCKTKSKDEE